MFETEKNVNILNGTDKLSNVLLNIVGIIDHVSRENIISDCAKLLSKEGVLLEQSQFVAGDYIVVTTKLIHVESQQCQISKFTIPFLSKERKEWNDAIEYSRRTSLCLIFGIEIQDNICNGVITQQENGEYLPLLKELMRGVKKAFLLSPLVVIVTLSLLKIINKC